MIEVTLKVQCDGCPKKDVTEYKAALFAPIRTAMDERILQLARERWAAYGATKFCPACKSARELTQRNVRQ